MLGEGKLSEGLALGRFQEFAERTATAGSTAPAALDREIRSGFGPLFGDRRKPEARALQDTLNELGTTQGPARFTPLAVDGDLGPKTTTAFEQAVRRDGPAAVTKAFGRPSGRSRLLRDATLAGG